MNHFVRSIAFSAVFFRAIILLLFFETNVFGGETLPAFFPTRDREPISSMEYVMDKHAKFDIDQIIRGDAGAFVKTDKKTWGFGYSNEALWIRFSVDLSRYAEPYWYFSSNYEHVGVLSIFYRNADDQFEKIELRELQPIEKRDFNVHNYLFKVPVFKNDLVTYYVKIVPSGHVLTTDFSWSNLRGVVEYMQTMNIGIGLFFGGLLVMLTYNAVLFIYLRSRAYFYYLYYLICFILFFVYQNGLASVFSNWSPLLEKFYAACAFAAIQGLILLGRHILLLRESGNIINRCLDYCLIVGQWITGIGAIAVFFMPVGVPYQILNGIILCVVPILMIAGVTRSFDGFIPARIYTIGWFVFSLGLAAVSLRLIGWIPTNWLTNYSVQIGSVFEAVIFAVALAYRIKQAEREKNVVVEERSKHELELLERERSQLEQRVTERTETLQSMLESRRMVLANASHELRTPVNALRLLLDSASSDKALSGTMASNVSVIASHMSQLVENLLLLNEEPQTQQGGPLQDFDIGEEIQVTANMLGPLRHGSSATFTLDVQSCADIMVCGDLTSLRRILINLLSNAFKFTHVGAVSLRASAEIDVEKNSVLCTIRVVDTGKGIPESMQTRIFDAFVTSGTHGAHVGTGLGLAISRQLAINLGGTLTLTGSAVAAGSEFALQLPFSVSSRCKHDATALIEDDVSDLAPAKRLKVLLAEDDPMTAQAVQLIVRQLQHEVTHVATYADLCKVLRHAGSSYDIALIDHRLPGGQGLDAIRECRIAGLPLPKRLVLVTADVTSTLLLEAKNSCDDVITKPTTAFVIRKLLRGVTSTVQKHDPISNKSSTKLSTGASIIDEAPLAMLKLCGAERRSLVHMCGTFNVTVNDTLTEIKPMLVTFDTGHHDMDILRKIVHRVRGSCLTMGAISLAAEFQKLAACDSSRMAERQYSVMVDTFLATKVALRVLLANMEKSA